MSLYDNGRISVFISSTKEDLGSYREAIFKKLNPEIFDIHGMEDFGARSENPIEVSLSEVIECKIYVGIIGMRYGSTDESGKSIVEREYETAVENEKPTLVYIIDEKEAKVHPKDVNCKNIRKLKNFKKKLTQPNHHTCYFFKSENHLATQVEMDLLREAKKKGWIKEIEWDKEEEHENRQFINASLNSSRLAKGDPLSIYGNSFNTALKSVAVWIFSKTFYHYQQIAVESNGSYEYTLENRITANFELGSYFVIIQHPMYNDRYDVFPVKSGNKTLLKNTANNDSVIIEGPGSVSGLDAAQAVIGMLNYASIDDIYIKLLFTVKNPWISIDPISDKYIGDKFTVMGQTNVALGDIVLITVTSSSFNFEEKTWIKEFSGISGSTVVSKGVGVNVWSFEIDTSTFRPDEYEIVVENVETGSVAAGSFFVSEVPLTYK